MWQAPHQFQDQHAGARIQRLDYQLGSQSVCSERSRTLFFDVEFVSSLSIFHCFPTDIFQAGDIIILDENINSGNRLAVIDFDGGDKIAASGNIAITRSAWATG